VPFNLLATLDVKVTSLFSVQMWMNVCKQHIIATNRMRIALIRLDLSIARAFMDILVMEHFARVSFNYFKDEILIKVEISNRFIPFVYTVRLR